jgi:hypothetical protein
VDVLYVASCCLLNLYVLCFVSYCTRILWSIYIHKLIYLISNRELKW